MTTTAKAEIARATEGTITCCIDGCSKCRVVEIVFPMTLPIQLPVKYSGDYPGEIFQAQHRIHKVNTPERIPAAKAARCP